MLSNKGSKTSSRKLGCHLKAGEGNPQAREEEGKRLFGLERSSSAAVEFPEFGNWNSVGKPPLWGLEFHGKATAFTSPYQPEHRLRCSLGSALRPWSLSSYLPLTGPCLCGQPIV